MSWESTITEAYMDVPHHAIALIHSWGALSGYPAVLFAAEHFGPQPYPVFYEIVLGQQFVCMQHFKTSDLDATN